MPSVDKIHRILEALRRHYKTGLTNKEISSEVGIPPSTSYRILAALRKHDYVRQNKKDARYYLGFAHLRLAEAVVEGLDLSAICLPYLEELHGQTEETTFFALFNGQTCVTMETCGQVDTRVAVGRGELMPLHASAAGKAVLAFLPRKEEERILQGLALEPYTPQTLRSAAALRKDLAEVRKSIATNLQKFLGINAWPPRSSATRAVRWLDRAGGDLHRPDRSQLEACAAVRREPPPERITGAIGSASAGNSRRLRPVGLDLPCFSCWREEHPFRRDRQVADAHPDGIPHGVGHGRTGRRD
jgi:DNA-binding IclR family transcriptional regulator